MFQSQVPSSAPSRTSASRSWTSRAAASACLRSREVADERDRVRPAVEKMVGDRHLDRHAGAVLAPVDRLEGSGPEACCRRPSEKPLLTRESRDDVEERESAQLLLRVAEDLAQRGVGALDVTFGIRPQHPDASARQAVVGRTKLSLCADAVRHLPGEIGDELGESPRRTGHSRPPCCRRPVWPLCVRRGRPARRAHGRGARAPRADLCDGGGPRSRCE